MLCLIQCIVSSVFTSSFFLIVVALQLNKCFKINELELELELVQNKDIGPASQTLLTEVK